MIKSLLNKRCVLYNPYSAGDPAGTNFTANLNFVNLAGEVFNEIYWNGRTSTLNYRARYHSYEVTFNPVNAKDSEIIITGGEDVNNPDVIDFIKHHFSIYSQQNNSNESLDNKIIEFNPTLTSLPGGLEYVIGTFSYYCICNNEKYYGFSDTIYIYNNEILLSRGSDLRYSFEINEWWYRDYYTGNEYIAEKVVFTNFKYTGLEENEEFMGWLSQNAKTSLKRNEDKKLISASNIDLTIPSQSNYLGDCFKTTYYPCEFLLNIEKYDRYMSDKTITLDYGGIVFDVNYHNYYDENGNLPIPEVAEGTYLGVITYVNNKWYFVLENGYQEELGVDENLTLKNFSLLYNKNDIDFVNWIVDNCEYKPTSIRNAIIKFKPQLTKISLMPGDYECKLYMSYTLNGELKSFLTNNVRILTNAIGDDDSILTIIFNDIVYSKTSNRWETDEEEAIQDVTIHYCDWTVDDSQKPDFINWLYENAEIIFAKGINTFDEFFEEIAIALKVKKNDISPINAQYMVSDIVNIYNGWGEEFTINSTYDGFWENSKPQFPYKARVGMTWKDWLESKYNKDFEYTGSGVFGYSYIGTGGELTIISNAADGPWKEDVIDQNMSYLFIVMVPE